MSYNIWSMLWKCQVLLCPKGFWRKFAPDLNTIFPSPQKGRAGLGHRWENYHVPGYGIHANSYLRLNEAPDTPKGKHIPKHLLFLRDFTKNPSGVVSDRCKSLGMTLTTPFFTGSAIIKVCSFAKCPGRGGGGGEEKIQIGQDWLWSVQNRMGEKKRPVPQVFMNFH